jgi:hypothetical protein
MNFHNLLKGKQQELKPKVAIGSAVFLLRNLEILGSNLSPKIGYSDKDFSQSLQSNSGIVPQNRTLLLPSTSLPIRYSLTIFHFTPYNLIYSQRLKKTLTVEEISRARNQRESLMLCLPPAFTLVSCSAYSSTLKKEAICSSETSVDFQRTTRLYIPEDSTLHTHRSEDLKSYIESRPYIVHVSSERVILCKTKWSSKVLYSLTF